METRGRTQVGNGDEDGIRDENRIGEGGRGAKKRKKPHTHVDAMWRTGETWVERGKNVEKKGLVQ